MLAALESRFKAIEAQRLALLAELKALDAEVLTFKPSADSWSVAGCSSIW